MPVELVLDTRAIIGESPTWVPEDRVLFWIDVKEPALHRLDPETLSLTSWQLASDIGGFALNAARDEALVALRQGLFNLNLSSGALSLAAPPPFDPQLHRFNEGACDSRGRFWIGTMFDPVSETPPPPKLGGLFSYTKVDGLRREPDEAELHNGMGWSPDERSFYLAHSKRGRVDVFSYDLASGKLGNRRRFLEIPPELGLPDGAAVDIEGCYWCAVHGGGRLRRYRPDGVLDQEVMLPVSQPTMCAFAGTGLDTLYVTTASDQLSPEQRRIQPLAGGLFRFRPAVPGVPRPYAFA
jgi:sugar lactone lactonase YvrE